MALVLGVDSGFVSTAPTETPTGVSGNSAIDGSAIVTKDTSPVGDNKITEIGFFRNLGTNTANFEVGLYAADGTDGVAGTLLFSSSINSSSVQGWIRVTVDWSIDPETDYWIGIQMDAHSGSSWIYHQNSGGNGIDSRTSQTTLPDPFGGGTPSDGNGMYAIYATYSVASASDIKKLSSIAQASLKKVSSIAEASVKKVSGVANV